VKGKRRVLDPLLFRIVEWRRRMKARFSTGRIQALLSLMSKLKILWALQSGSNYTWRKETYWPKWDTWS
jgi:hypothetical protein